MRDEENKEFLLFQVNQIKDDIPVNELDSEDVMLWIKYNAKDLRDRYERARLL